jgi:carbonic anhydrase
MKRVARILLGTALAALFSFRAVSLPAEHREHSEGAAKAPSADQIWGLLLDGNRRFVAGTPTHHDLVSQRHTLEKDQHPLVAILSCSDSRVPPEVVFDQGLGDIFVVRVAGNSADALGIGSLEYAVEHLGTVMIVVLGHQSCGAVTAACSGKAPPTSNLEAVVQPITQSCRFAKQEQADDSLVEFAIKDHVHRTAQELLAHSTVLKNAHDHGNLAIVEAYYSLDSGAVMRLR